jgi:hypothetical protein
MHSSSLMFPPCKTQQRQVSDWSMLPQPIVLSRCVETLKSAVSSVKYYFMKSVLTVMCSLQRNLQLVEGSQYLVEIEFRLSQAKKI